MDSRVPQQVEDRFSYHQGVRDDFQPPMVDWDRESNSRYMAQQSRQVGNITINGDVYINNRPARYSEAYREMAVMSPEMMADMQPWTVRGGDYIQPRQVGRVGYQTVDYRGTDVQVYGPRTGVVIRDERANYGYPPYGYQRDAGDDALRALQIIGGAVGIVGVAKDIFDGRGGRHHRGGYYDRGYDRGGYYDRGYNDYQNYQWQQYRQQQQWQQQQWMNQRRYQSNCYQSRGYCR